MGFFINIARNLKAKLPYYTDLFSDIIEITECSYNDCLLTITTKKPHNLNAHDYVILKNIKSKFSLSDISYNKSNGILKAELEETHEIFIEDTTIELKGFSVEGFNGIFKIISLNNLTIEIQLPILDVDYVSNNQEVALKILNGGFNSFFEVSSIANIHTFTVAKWFYEYKLDYSNAIILTSRVYATAEDINTLFAIKQETANRNEIYITLNQISINKRSKTMDFEKDNLRFVVGYEIAVYVKLAINLKIDSVGAYATDLMINKVFKALNKCLLSGSFVKEQPSRLLSLNSIEKFLYAKNTLVYAFKYTLPLEIVEDDGVDATLERRLKELVMDVNVDNKDLLAVAKFYPKEKQEK